MKCDYCRKTIKNNEYKKVGKGLIVCSTGRCFDGTLKIKAIIKGMSEFIGGSDDNKVV